MSCPQITLSFLLLLISLPYLPLYKSLPFCTAPGRVLLVARWDADWCTNHPVKQIRCSNLLRWILFFDRIQSLCLQFPDGLFPQEKMEQASSGLTKICPWPWCFLGQSKTSTQWTNTIVWVCSKISGQGPSEFVELKNWVSLWTDISEQASLKHATGPSSLPSCDCLTRGYHEKVKKWEGK